MTRGRELIREKCQASKSLEDKIFHRKSIKLGKYHSKTWLFKFTQIPGNPATICPYFFNYFQIQELLAQATHTRRAKLSAALTLSVSLDDSTHKMRMERPFQCYCKIRVECLWQYPSHQNYAYQIHKANNRKIMPQNSISTRREQIFKWKKRSSKYRKPAYKSKLFMRFSILEIPTHL